jgi:hypothetical protein
VYLVDTNVISAAAPAPKAASAALGDWMHAHSARLHISAVTVAEIEAGIAKARRERALRKAKELNAWLETVLHLYRERVLPLDVAVARVAGRMSDQARSRGRQTGFADIVIAATATHHRLIVLTRNLKHFAPLAVRAHDPFVALPPG